MAAKRIRITPEQLVAAMQGSCSTCWHWERDGASESGECHRFPPFVHSEPDEDGGVGLFSVWPQTALTDQCGEFKPKQ